MRRLGALLLALVAVGGALLTAAFAVFMAGFRCYESCSESGDAPWHDRADAMQWNVLGIVGVAVAIAGIVAVVLILTGHRRDLAAAVVYCGVAVVAAAFLESIATTFGVLVALPGPLAAFAARWALRSEPQG